MKFSKVDNINAYLVGNDLCIVKNGIIDNIDSDGNIRLNKIDEEKHISFLNLSNFKQGEKNYSVQDSFLFTSNIEIAQKEIRIEFKNKKEKEEFFDWYTKNGGAQLSNRSRDIFINDSLSKIILEIDGVERLKKI